MLDGAVLVLCAVAGVQSQSITVDRQMKRYAVPRIAFINKMDRTGANPANVIQQLESKLGLTTVPLQIPIGAESNFQGVIDLIDRKAIYFDGEKGEDVRREPIPADLAEAAERARQGMLEALSLVSDEIMELLLEEQEVPLDLIHKTIREGTIAQQICPVLVGSAYKQQGRPAAARRRQRATCPARSTARSSPRTTTTAWPRSRWPPTPTRRWSPWRSSSSRSRSARSPTCGSTRGRSRRATFYYNARQRKKARISRILRVHADQKEDIDSAGAGDIVAVMGIECATGDTYCAEGTNLSLESIYAAEPVIDLSIQPAKRADYDKLSKALNRFMREDPTFRVHVDQETSETIISGMGELHLEIYVERIRREYKVECTVGAPKVSYREAPTKRDAVQLQAPEADRRLGPVRPRRRRHGSRSTPRSPEPFVFENEVTGGRIPSEYIPSVEKGFRESLHKGPVAGYEVIGVKMRLEDGSYHDVDSSDMAFQICARDCFRETFRKADPVLLEPIMKVEVEIPTEFQGPVTGAISSKRGVILGTESRVGLRRHPGRGPAGRDVRLLERPPQHDPGQGELQHGVPQVPEAPLAGSRKRSSRRPRPSPRSAPSNEPSADRTPLNHRGPAPPPTEGPGLCV